MARSTSSRDQYDDAADAAPLAPLEQQPPNPPNTPPFTRVPIPDVTYDIDRSRWCKEFNPLRPSDQSPAIVNGYIHVQLIRYRTTHKYYDGEMQRGWKPWRWGLNLSRTSH